MKVVTYQSPRGSRISVCPDCENRLSGWPKDSAGQEYAAVYFGLHEGRCDVHPIDPRALKAWREFEGLTQEQAGEVAGVQIRAWQRWESGERDVPQWLPDVLRQRWGSSP